VPFTKRRIWVAPVAEIVALSGTALLLVAAAPPSSTRVPFDGAVAASVMFAWMKVETLPAGSRKRA
jgi:hypothetical protein